MEKISHTVLIRVNLGNWEMLVWCQMQQILGKWEII